MNRMGRLTTPHRLESERQWLIAELLRLRREGLNVDRQEAILLTLRSGWEYGWPEPRRRVLNGQWESEP